MQVLDEKKPSKVEIQNADEDWTLVCQRGLDFWDGHAKRRLNLKGGYIFRWVLVLKDILLVGNWCVVFCLSDGKWFLFTRQDLVLQSATIRNWFWKTNYQTRISFEIYIPVRNWFWFTVRQEMTLKFDNQTGTSFGFFLRRELTLTDYQTRTRFDY